MMQDDVKVPVLLILEKLSNAFSEMAIKNATLQASNQQLQEELHEKDHQLSEAQKMVNKMLKEKQESGAI